MNWNRRSLLAAPAFAALSACATPRGTVAAAEPAPVLSAAMAETATPGLAAMVMRDFRVEDELIAGVRRLGHADAVARGDRWHLGSDGKAITATMIARLVERGVLTWDTPLEMLLPQFARSMHEAYRDVTLPDLLSHRAGLPENHDDMDFFNTFYDDTAPLTQQRLRYVDTALRDAPVGAKRAEQSYSNTGYLLAGAAAEQASGQAFEALMAAEVFAPLSMETVSFDQYGGAGEPCGHVEGRVADQPHDANPRMFAPAGGMRMALSDWARLCIDHMQGAYGRGRLLRTETYQFLHTGQGETRSALGWGAAPSPMGLRGPALTHAGSDGNWYALVALFPETGNGVLVAANAGDSMGGDAAAVAALRLLAANVAEPMAPAAD